MKSLLWSKVVGAAMIVGLILSVSVSANGIGGRPANPDPNNPRTSSIFIYNLSGGDSKSDQLYVQNGSDKEETIEVYSVDGTVTTTGDMTCKEKSEDKVGAGKWVSVSKKEVTLGANENTLVDFTVNVPSKADVGEHNACMVVQRKVKQSSNNAGGIQVQTRQAIRMAITVPGDIHRDVTIEKFNVKNSNSSQLYEIALKNSGNVSADVDVKLVVKDPMGNVVYKNGGVNAMIANETRQFNFDSNLAPFWGGKYKVELSISYKKKAGEWGISQDQNELITKTAESKELFFWPSTTALMMIGGGILLFIILIVIIVIKSKRNKKTVQFKKR